jgi:hypothetical protein
VQVQPISPQSEKDGCAHLKAVKQGVYGAEAVVAGDASAQPGFRRTPPHPFQALLASAPSR